jgi:NAD(P)-dependent dehydrogenase (short-subunit alcohol dehydrogenase family)
MEAKLSEMRRGPPPVATEHWALAAGYEGIERAQLVVINVRSEDERVVAQILIEDVVRLRKDEAVFRDIIGHRGYKLPVTAVVADLSDPKDPGLKKAVARVKRATKRRLP